MQNQGEGKRAFKISAESAISNTRKVILPIGSVAKRFGICWKKTAYWASIVRVGRYRVSSMMDTKSGDDK